MMTRQEAKAEAEEKNCYFGLAGKGDDWQVDESRNPDYSPKGSAPPAKPKGEVLSKPKGEVLSKPKGEVLSKPKGEVLSKPKGRGR